MTMGCGSSKKILNESPSDRKVKTTLLPEGNSSREANSNGNKTNAKRKLAENGVQFRARFDTSVTEKYSIKALIGEGSFSKVVRVEHRTTKQPYAIKMIKIKKGKDVFESELAVLRKVQHAYVVRLYEVFECKDKVYLVMELATGGELFERIVSRGYFTERDATHVLYMVLEGVRYLHSLGITHRDLKPENLLYYHPGNDSKIMITDFGLSNLKKSPDDSTMETTCGTPEYIAPEILMSMPYTNSVDMWSIGVISYILLSGSMPFADDNRTRLYRAILTAKFNYSCEPWNDVSDLAKDFINKLLVFEPAKRMTAEEGLKHPWIASFAASSSFKNLHGSISSNWLKSSSRLNSAKSNRSKRSSKSSKSGRSVLSKYKQSLPLQKEKSTDIQAKQTVIRNAANSLPDCSEPKGTQLKLTKQLVEKLQSVVANEEPVDVHVTLQSDDIQHTAQTNIPVSHRGAHIKSKIPERDTQHLLQIPPSNTRIHDFEKRMDVALSADSVMSDGKVPQFSKFPPLEQTNYMFNDAPSTMQFYGMLQPTNLHKLSNGHEEIRDTQAVSNYQSNQTLRYHPTSQTSQRNNFFGDGHLSPQVMDVDMCSNEGTINSASSGSLAKPVRFKSSPNVKRNKVSSSF